MTVFLLSVVYLLYSYYFGAWSVPTSVRVTNVTGRSATISWVTEKATSGVVVYGEKDNFLPWVLSGVGKEKAFDDRDVVKALKTASKRVAGRLAHSDSDTVTSSDLREDVVISKNGRYYVHHVTLSQLDPEKEYYFMVGNGLRYEVENSKDSGKFTTFADLDTLLVPSPAYGIIKIWGDEEIPLGDGVLYMRLKSGNAFSSDASAVLNENGSWYIDVGGIRAADGKYFLSGVDDDSFSELLTIESGIYGKYLKVITSDQDSPAQDIQVQDPELELNQPDMKYLGNTISSVQFSASLLGIVEANDCSETGGQPPCSFCKSCHYGCNMGGRCGYMGYCTEGCSVPDPDSSCECGCNDVSKVCSDPNHVCKDKRCVDKPQATDEPANASDGACGNKANGTIGYNKGGCENSNGTCSGLAGCSCWKCNNGLWNSINMTLCCSDDAKDTGPSPETCEENGGEAYDETDTEIRCTNPRGTAENGDSCCEKGKVEVISEATSCEELGLITTYTAFYICPGTLTENWKFSSTSVKCCDQEPRFKTCLEFGAYPFNEDTEICPSKEYHFQGTENQPQCCFNRPVEKKSDEDKSTNSECDGYFQTSDCDSRCSPNSQRCVSVKIDSSCMDFYFCGYVETVEVVATPLFNNALSSDAARNGPLLCGEVRDNECALVCNADENSGAPFKDIQKMIVSNLVNPAYAQTGDEDFDAFVMSASRGVYSFNNEGVYCTVIDKIRYCFEIDTAGPTRLYIDMNDSASYDEGDVDIGQDVDKILVTRESLTNIYSIKLGFNLISFNLVGATAEEMMASTLLASLNSKYNDAFFSIARFEDGKWDIVGNRNGISYGGNDFQIIPGRGYLLKATKTFEMAVTGKRVVSAVPVSLVEGWNLIAVHGDVGPYTASSLIDSIDAVSPLDADNVTQWDVSRSLYVGLQKEKDAGGNMEVYGYDFPIDPISSYFVRVASGSGTWTPETGE